MEDVPSREWDFVGWMLVGRMQIEKGRNATQNEALLSYVWEGTTLRSEVLWKTCAPPIRTLEGKENWERGRILGKPFGETLTRILQGVRQQNAGQRGPEGRRVSLIRNARMGHQGHWEPSRAGKRRSGRPCSYRDTNARHDCGIHRQCAVSVRPPSLPLGATPAQA